MEKETNLPEEENSILTLTDENGRDMNFEYLDCIEYKGKEYLLVMPADTLYPCIRCSPDIQNSCPCRFRR